MRADEPITPIDLTAGEIKFYRDEGFLLIPGLMNESSANDLRAEVMDLMESIGGYEGSKLKQSAEYKSGSHIERLIHSAPLREVAQQLMNGPASVFLPFTAVKGTGGGRFHFHQDNQYTQFDDGFGGVNLWFALAPMTPQNGCLQIVPRSHLNGTLASQASGDGDVHKKVTFEPHDFLPIRMRAGDCVAFTRLTVHGSGPNQTAHPRVAYAMQYFRNDVSWIDKQTGQKHLLTDSPRYNIKPVERYSVPTGKADGH